MNPGLILHSNFKTPLAQTCPKSGIGVTIACWYERGVQDTRHYSSIHCGVWLSCLYKC